MPRRNAFARGWARIAPGSGSAPGLHLAGDRTRVSQRSEPLPGLPDVGREREKNNFCATFGRDTRRTAQVALVPQRLAVTASICCSLAPCLRTAAAIGEPMATAMPHGHRACRAHARALARATHQNVWETLIHYDGFACFVPGLRASRMLSRSGATCIPRQAVARLDSLVSFPRRQRCSFRRGVRGTSV